MPSILKVFDNEGVEIPIPAIQGPRGLTGATGPAGPNSVSTSTDSSISGLLKGAGGKVAQAVAGTDYVTPASTMRRLISRTIGAGENVSAITWTQDDAGNALSLIDAEIRIRAGSNSLANGADAFITLRINDQTSNYYSTGSSFSSSSVILCRVRNSLSDGVMSLRLNKNAYTLNTITCGYDSAGASGISTLYQGAYFNATNIAKIYIALISLTYLPTGTVIEIYGRTA